MKEIRERNIRCFCFMRRWTTFVDKHEEGKKIPFRDQQVYERERERERQRERISRSLGIVEQSYG